MRILHIDDEPWVVEGIRDMLKDKGYEVGRFDWPSGCVSEDDPLPALDAYDVVILDIIMPSGPLSERGTRDGYLTGVVLCRKYIRPQYPDMPVILLSALPPGTTERSTAEEYAKKVPGIRYVEKPVDERELIDTIDEVVKGKEEATRERM